MPSCLDCGTRDSMVTISLPSVRSFQFCEFCFRHAWDSSDMTRGKCQKCGAGNVTVSELRDWRDCMWCSGCIVELDTSINRASQSHSLHMASADTKRPILPVQSPSAIQVECKRSSETRGVKRIAGDDNNGRTAKRVRYNPENTPKPVIQDHTQGQQVKRSRQARDDEDHLWSNLLRSTPSGLGLGGTASVKTATAMDVDESCENSRKRFKTESGGFVPVFVF